MTSEAVTITKLSKEIARAEDVRRALQDQDDPQLILDMIEGETNLHEAVAVIYEEAVTDIALVAGIKDMVASLNERKSRLEKGIETKRGLILMAMERAQVPTIRTPLATITVKKTPAVAIITDESALPAKFWQAQDPKLDKQAVTEALNGGEAVPGAELSNGGIALQIRVK